MEFLRLLLRDVTIKDVANHDTYSNPGTRGGGGEGGGEGGAEQGQGSYRSWKTWKDMEIKNFIFSFSRPGKSWNLIVGP